MNIHVHYVDDSHSFILSVRRALLGARDKFFRGEPATFTFEGFEGPSQYKTAILGELAARPDIILLDLAMNNDDRAGIKLAKSVRKLYPSAKIIMFTLRDDSKTVVACMNAGVDNFLAKNEDFPGLPSAILDSLRLSEPIPQDGDGPLSRFSGKTIQEVANRIPRIIKSAIRAVHVQGETGTGKEVIADLIEASIGNKVPFVRINCGAIAPNLVESELFGYVRGAFTGAQSDKQGLFEMASGGWIFADEVALLPPHAQRALLRVIENQEVMRVGDTKRRKINVRILSATNESLEQGVAEGRFRRDLWQRLSEAVIALPPLRERMDELPDLVNYFARSMEGGPYIVPATTLEVLKEHNWANGNIRELRNTLRSMTELQVDRVLWPKAVPRKLYETMAAPDIGTSLARPDPDHEIRLPVNLGHFDLREVEDDLLAEAIKLFASEGGTVSLNQLQTKVGVSKATLSRRVRVLIETKRLPAEMFSLRSPSGEE